MVAPDSSPCGLTFRAMSSQSFHGYLVVSLVADPNMWQGGGYAKAILQYTDVVNRVKGDVFTDERLVVVNNVDCIPEAT